MDTLVSVSDPPPFVYLLETEKENCIGVDVLLAPAVQPHTPNVARAPLSHASCLENAGSGLFDRRSRPATIGLKPGEHQHRGDRYRPGAGYLGQYARGGFHPQQACCRKTGR